MPSPVSVLVATTSTLTQTAGELFGQSFGREVVLGQHHDRLRAAFPGDDQLALDSRR